VRREYRRKPQDNPVDYALLVYGEPCLFVEAKTLTNTLDHRKCASQVLGYASVVGVGWCLVTNGDDYRLYNSHAAVDVEEKLFRAVRLSDLNREDECLDTLGLLAKDQMGDKALEVLWKGQFVDRRVKAAVADLWASDEARFAKLVHGRTPELTLGEVKDSLKRAKLSIDFPSIAVPLRSAKMDNASPAVTLQKREPRASGSRTRLIDLIASGVLVPPLEIEVEYKDVRLVATVDETGAVVFDGRAYDSPSAAGGAAKGSVVGSPLATDGWRFWQFRDAQTGKLRPLSDLREKYLASRKEMG